MPKPPKEGPECSREREFKVILEDLHGQFKVFGEGQKDLCQRVERIEQKVDVIERDVSQIKSFLKPLTAQVSDHEHRINNHETRLALIEKSR